MAATNDIIMAETTLIDLMQNISLVVKPAQATTRRCNSVPRDLSGEKQHLRQTIKELQARNKKLQLKNRKLRKNARRHLLCSKRWQRQYHDTKSSLEQKTEQLHLANVEIESLERKSNDLQWDLGVRERLKAEKQRQVQILARRVSEKQQSLDHLHAISRLREEKGKKRGPSHSIKRKPVGSGLRRVVNSGDDQVPSQSQPLV